MSTTTRAQELREIIRQVLYSTPMTQECEIPIAVATLRNAIEGLNIEPNPDRELSIEKHFLIQGQNWVKDAILRLADELEKMK